MDAHRDFTPTREQVSLHGLGFIQVKLDGGQRLHVWHPDLPRRACFDHSPIHNHRFGFRSTVLVGVQVNRRYAVVDNPGDLPDATHDLISHDGPRSPLGGRYSCVAGTAIVKLLNQEHIRAGASYKMDVGEYHETPNNGIVVTVLQKLHESTDFHASTLIERGHTFDQDFDRFQVPPERLWQFVVDALGSAA